MISHLGPLSFSLPVAIAPVSCSLSLVQHRNAPLASKSYWWSGGCESYLIFQKGVWSWTTEAGTITGSGQRNCWAGLVTFANGGAWLSSEQLCGSLDRFTCSWKQTPLTWNWGYKTIHLLFELRKTPEETLVGDFYFIFFMFAKYLLYVYIFVFLVLYSFKLSWNIYIF